jgi:hypothetical protein
MHTFLCVRAYFAKCDTSARTDATSPPWNTKETHKTLKKAVFVDKKHNESKLRKKHTASVKVAALHANDTALALYMSTRCGYTRFPHTLPFSSQYETNRARMRHDVKRKLTAKNVIAAAEPGTTEHVFL